MEALNMTEGEERREERKKRTRKGGRDGVRVGRRETKAGGNEKGQRMSGRDLSLHPSYKITEISFHLETSQRR